MRRKIAANKLFSFNAIMVIYNSVLLIVSLASGSVGLFMVYLVCMDLVFMSIRSDRKVKNKNRELILNLEFLEA